MAVAERTDPLLLIDARLAHLSGELAAARQSGDAPLVALLRRRLDTVLETRLSETKR